jgi:hypothetical protein
MFKQLLFGILIMVIVVFMALELKNAIDGEMNFRHAMWQEATER